MLTGRLGNTDLLITRLGLGAWAIGGAGWQGGWGPQDDNASVAAIHHAVKSGINWIDTAPAYGLGHAEEVVGQAVAALPADERPLIFTKCGLVWEPGGTTVTNVLAPHSIRRECEDSLRRLGVEALDLLQVHWPTWDGTPVEESWATMADLVTEGKVRHIGVSNFDVDLLARCQAVRQVDTYQPQLNLLLRNEAEAAIPWCAAHGVGVIVYSPMRSGLLTGAFSPERALSLPEDDWRSIDPDFTEPRLSRNLAFVERLRPLAARHRCSPAELAIAWAVAWPGVDGAIVGARRPEQIDGWIAAGEVRLDEDGLKEIGELLLETGAGEGPTCPPPRLHTAGAR